MPNVTTLFVKKGKDAPSAPTNSPRHPSSGPEVSPDVQRRMSPAEKL
ncbi:MAG: hypothetical protein ACLQGV_02490 [Bryobacteraceae bacterium]